ncbi:MAG: nasD [Solirubrobacterales bacterium]|nr:nasD [Solirubrobacterales bacterium]
MLLDGWSMGAGEAAPPVDAAAGDPGATICSCQAVTRGEIAHAIEDRGLTTVAQVSEHTRASTGCGGCRPDVAELLAAIRAPVPVA